MKRNILLYAIIALLLISCSQDISNDSGRAVIESMISKPNGTLALITMQEPQPLSNNIKSYSGGYTLSAYNGNDFIPLLFSLTDGEIVSIKATDVLLFDRYISCTVDGIIRYPNDINEENLEEHIDGNQIDCGFYDDYFYAEIIIDTKTGKIIDMSNMPFSSIVGFDDDYIYLAIQSSRILKIDKDNLNSGEYITSDIEQTGLTYILGDYVVGSNEKAYLKDNSDVPSYTDGTLFGRIDARVFSYMLPNDHSSSDIYVYYQSFDEYDDSKIYVSKVSAAKGTFGKILSKTDISSDVPGIGLDSEMNYDIATKIDNGQIPNILRPYNQTASNLSSDISLITNKYETMGNLFININENKCWYFIEDPSSESGIKLVVETKDYSPLKNIKSLKDRDNNDAYKAYLYQSDLDLYYLSQDNHIEYINLYTGEHRTSDYVVNLDSCSTNFMTLSGNLLVYRELVNGSEYVTKKVNITDLETSPEIVSFSITDTVSIPDFRF